MLSKCANPSCSTPFIYLREGKIFLTKPMVDSTTAHGRSGSHATRLEYFWLCGPCSEDLTLLQDPALGTRVVSKKTRIKRAAA
jgi:hypothetical protein